MGHGHANSGGKTWWAPNVAMIPHPSTDPPFALEPAGTGLRAGDIAGAPLSPGLRCAYAAYAERPRPLPCGYQPAGR